MHVLYKIYDASRSTQTNGFLPRVVALLLIGLLVLAVGCSGSQEAVENAESQYPTVLSPESFDTVYSVDAVDERPEPEGGMSALLDRVNYPEAARQAGVTGRVMVAFIIAPDGRATNIRVAESVHPLLDDEARRAVKESAFTSGLLDGEVVPVQVELPVTFDQSMTIQ